MKTETKFIDGFRRFFPDPFVFAIILSLIAFVLSAIFGFKENTGGNFIGGLNSAGLAWSSGMWTFLAFAMQMSLILLFGFVLANAPFVSRIINILAALTKNPKVAIWMTAFVSCGCALIHWGLGLIVGALLAKQVGKNLEEKGVEVHYPLLAAAGYSSLLVWHGGLTGSASLKASNLANLPSFLEGVSIPLAETTFSQLNFTVAILSLLIIPILFARMHQKSSDVKTYTMYTGLEVECKSGDANADGGAVANKIENTRFLPLLFAFFLLYSVVLWVLNQANNNGGFLRIDWLNAINAIFFSLALLAHPSIRHFLTSVGTAVKGVAGIMIQFPLYAGTASVLMASGLASALSGWIVDLPGSQVLLPVYSFFAAGIVNLFVPSGGGQFIIQGPILFEAQQMLNAGVSNYSAGTWLLALSYGDQWSNMLQPFWAIPLLAITGVKAREMMGFTVLVMIYVMPLYLGALYFLG